MTNGIDLMKITKPYSARLILPFIIILQIATTPLYAGELSGKVVGITDGDTLTLLVPGNRQVKIRLSEIDAPERNQPYGAKSKTALSNLVFGKTIFVKDTTSDRYGRTVGRVHTNSADVSAEMVRSGAAWVYTKYASDPTLPVLQKDAKHNKMGLWMLDNPIPPWEWRKGTRNGKTSIGTGKGNSCLIKGNINRKGDHIYHVPSGRDYAATVINTSKGERWFCSETEAQQAGWRAPRN